MKHLKTTIKLSVLALACLGAGALALQPTAYAKAEDSADCLTMQNGAAVCVKDDFSGIRWTTKVDFEKYQTLCGAGRTIQFGTLVLPTDMLGEDGVLTDADESAVDIPANIDVDNIANDTEFYTIVNYDNLADAYEGTLSEEDALKKAYEMELTARSYVKVNGRYYFTEEMGTSRSARQVALAAELAGDWDDSEEAKATKAAKYYGMSARYTPAEVSNGAAGTAVIDLNNGETPEQEVLLRDMDIEGEIKSVFVGAERVKYKSYTKDSTKILTFEVAEGQIFPTGETYVSIFTDSGFYTKPIICATKIIETKEDLALFNAKGGYGAYSSKVTVDGWEEKYRRDSQEQSGYYVLQDNIDATGYVHGSRIAADYKDVTGQDAPAGEFNNQTWNGVKSYLGKPIGLTGTFNGLGYSINNMEMGSEREGLFGIVNGGTVKNVGFIDVQATGVYKFVLANYLYKAKVENVYIKTDEYKAHQENETDAEGNPVYEFVLDKDGNKIRETDAEGKPKTDAEGNPVYQQQIKQKTVVDSMGFPMANCAGLSNYASGNTTLKSLFIHYAKANSDGDHTGVMFSAYHDDFTAADVYCVSDNVVNGQYTHTLMFVEKTNGFDVKDKENYNDTKRVWLAENEQSRKCTDGSVLNFVPAKYEYTLDEKTGRPSEGYTAPDNNTNKKVGKYGLLPDDLKVVLYGDITRPRVVMMGALRYDSVDAMIKYDSDHSYYNTAITEGMSYKNLVKTGCWHLDGNNRLVWGANA